MCIVYNQVGSLTTIKSHLRNHNVNDFNSINEILAFQKNYSNVHQEILSNHSSLILKEKESLKEEILQLGQLIELRKFEMTSKLNLELDLLNQKFSSLLINNKSNVFKIVFIHLKKYSLKNKIKSILSNFDCIITDSIRDLSAIINTKTTRLNFIASQFNDAVSLSARQSLQELERKKTVIEYLLPTILGAIGENKVSKELETLSDDYILINDFTCSFHPALYNRNENDYIKSVQIDHILIGPSGIFLIETKNWSEHSINNFKLRSPIEQIKRTNFSLFKILNENISISLGQHHWGNRKITIRNLIVMINQKPREEFQYVKIVTLKELKNYVMYFDPIFSKNEIEILANYLININEIKSH